MFANQHQTLAGQSWSSTPLTRPPPPDSAPLQDPYSHTQQPITTGTSVLGVKFDGGVMLAADTLGASREIGTRLTHTASYGSMAKFDDVQRLHAVGQSTCVAAGGDMSDWQHLKDMLDARVRSEFVEADGISLRPRQIYEWLGRLLYGRRTKVDPLWVSLLVGGYDKGEAFLGYVDLLGTTYSSPTIATGYGAHMAQPLMRKATEGREGQISRAEAEELLEKCMRVLYYRDARSINKYQIATITATGVTISEPKHSQTSWGFAEKLRGYGAHQE